METQKTPAYRASDARRLRLRIWPAIALVGGVVLLGLIVSDGVRNLAPDDDAVTAHAAPDADGSDDVSASFPRYATQAVSAEKARECARASGPAVSTAQPIGDRSRWLTSIDYPLASLQAGHEGVSGMMMTIDTAGRIADCETITSSGHALLDAAACTTLRMRARFEPARDAAGCPVPTTYRQRVRWQIPID